MAKYELRQTQNSWAIVMSGSNRVMETCESEDSAQRTILEWESGSRRSEERPEVWVIGEFVSEPSEDGMQLGAVSELDMSQYTVTATFTQDEYDQSLQSFYDENGYYLGQ